MRLFVLFLLLVVGCRRAHSHELARRAPAPIASAPATAPAPARVDAAPGWTEVFHLRHRPTGGHDLEDVVVHAPPGFDPRAPLHVVLFFHGIWSHAAWWVVSGPLAPVTGEPGSGWGLASWHDRAGVNALLIAPQLLPRGTAGFSGAFRRAGFLRAFLDEVLGEALAVRLGGRRGVDDVATITMVGASGGGPLIAGLLARGDLADRVRSAVVVDGLYGGEDAFASWMRASTAESPRRFVCVHAGSRYTAPHAAGLARRLGALGIDTAVNARGALSQAVRDHRAVFAVVPCDHVGMSNVVYDKVVGSLGLPARRRGQSEPLRVPAGESVAPIGALTLGVTSQGAFSPGDARLRDWTWFDDWSLDLAAGQRVRVEARGVVARGGRCSRSDVELEVFDVERSLARDDDGAGALGARVEVTAPRAGRYTVRVMEHESCAVAGRYVVSVEEGR